MPVLAIDPPASSAEAASSCITPELASGCVTLYQMALIETGNLGGLMLGPVRVVDRLRATPHEAVYRVFDPRRRRGAGEYALLRHLAEADMHDAVRPDEYRQRFRAALAVQQPNVTATLEVLDIAGRPAALQEWVTGVPACDWPAFVAAPGVVYHLLHQAALGLQAAHEAGLLHGHIDADHVMLTGDGTLKLSGFGEPPWLCGHGHASDSTLDDLAALKELIADCVQAAAPRRKGGKAKPLPDGLRNVLYRLSAEAGEERYASAAELLDDLRAVENDIPNSSESWDRLLDHIAEQLNQDSALRQSA